MRKLRICIVGGIYDKAPEYRMLHRFTPETVLSEGLSAQGHDVITSGHSGFVPAKAYDVVHVHHLGRAALKMATANSGGLFLYTSHDPRMVSRYKPTIKRMIATRIVASRADAMVTLSNTEMNLMKVLFGKYHAKIVVIANGFPKDIFFHRERTIPTTATFKLLFVGQLIEQKGFDVLLRAFRKVSLSRQIELRVVYQTAELEKYYKGMAMGLGIKEKVHFLGFKSAYELADLYQTSDLLVLPTYAEALPSVITEAMMCGVPVIATAVGGIPEQVGKYGILVQPGDVEGLALAIYQALDHLTDLLAQGKARSHYAMREFNKEEMINKHISLYEELLSMGTMYKRNRAGKRILNLFMQHLL